jgi:nucleoside 2-deoxyribosyltransferase
MTASVSDSPAPLTRIYLAGPEVFLPDPFTIGERKKKLCADYGLVGLYPMDNEIDLAGLPPREAALRIGRLNEEMIRGCDAVVANITPFRGPSADVGTAYEMGFAAGLGKVVCAYTNAAATFAERTTAHFGGRVTRDAGGRLRDPDGLAVEDWGLVDNLMLESCVAHSGGRLVVSAAGAAELFTDLKGFKECLAALRSPAPVPRRP